MFFKRRQPSSPSPAAAGPGLASDPAGGAWRFAQGLIWVSQARVGAGWWSSAHAQFAESGLWPVFLSGLRPESPLRPWETGELRPQMITTDPGDHDPAVLLRDWFDGHIPDDPEELDEVGANVAPFFDGWPGFAPPGTGGTDPERHAAEVAELLVDFDRVTDARLGLARCPRGADLPALIGWTGPVNHENDTARFSAVLRSWEDRFGARLIALGFDTMILSVAAPPRDRDHARLVAAEHLAFCPDTITQGTESLEDYAAELVGAEQWEFWWD
ncbi:DUF4253 domain-containing protein [Actinoplanes palleronii]|uniref:DUF4253 domain-containing protein n=1 Tax=Actinoplanes palleronii TaxID=113570 RepID=A0ABQ4BBI6_9ACTN|nr:DUF4253 domain-containing protein [Actinoplanes palleronii]GIE68018.1 hypothetical protein Apa02nite_041260 [Actinoplanes palleronii]